MPIRRKPSTPEPRPGGFHITRLDPPRPSARTPAEQPSAEPPPESLLVVRLRWDADALTFAAAVQDHREGQTPGLLRAPDGAVWMLIHEPPEGIAELGRALGGSVCRVVGGDLTWPGGRYPWAVVRAFPPVSLVELATGVAPGDGIADQEEVVIVTTGGLARWVLDRFHSSGADLRVAAAQLRGLYSTDRAAWAAVLVHATGQDGPVPPVLARAVGRLPHTVVCRVGGGRLLVDQRLALPFADAELGRAVPEGQEWLLAADLGLWAINRRSREHPPPLRAAPGLLPPTVPAPGRLPVNLETEVRLIPDEQPRTVDALLLRDEELPPLRRYLGGQPTAEEAMLILGSGMHLLAEPGRELHDVPFGVPVHRIGPGALYQEVGYRLQPALPAPARARLFALDQDSTVVLLGSGEARRLSLRNTVPVWSLWLGPAVPADPTPQPLSPAAVAILERAAAAAAPIDETPLTPDASAASHPAEADARMEGFLLEQQGKLAEAARRYWDAGEPALAARLYEQAAETDR